MAKQKSKKSKAKAYREGYNNPSFFDPDILLNSNDPFAQDVIRGITDRAKDEINNTVRFVK